MEARQLNTILLESFPELTEQFNDYTSWQDGIDTGCFLIYEDLLLPIIRNAINKQDTKALKRVGAFIDKIYTLNDEYADNVVTVGILEGLKANKHDVIRQYLGPKALAEYDALS